MKIITVIGARPQFIKASVMSKNIRSKKKKNKIREVLVHTGQHYDYLMDRVFFDELDLPKPDYYLGVGSHSHGKQTAMMLERVEDVLKKEKPDLVMVYGDTNSTLAGALGGAKLKIPVAHIEAGLRSFNRKMPEEINRVLTDHISTFLFCPTVNSVKNLEHEGIKDGNDRVVRNVGDVMYDSLIYYSKIAERKSSILKELDLINTNSHNSKLTTCHYYLATIHREENTDNPERLNSILKALYEIAKDVIVIFPVHPRTKKTIDAHRLLNDPGNIRLIEPVSYLNMLMLEKHARLILTDSGGVQKEAFWFGVPCLSFREDTEWIETVRSGWNILVGAETERIIRGLEILKKKKINNKRRNLFGDGRACEKIINILNKYM